MSTSTERLKEYLRQQLGFLARSSDSYDHGYQDEGIRIATSIRVMLHDTKNSTSLLSQLQGKNVKLLSICMDIGSKPGLIYFNGMGQLNDAGHGPKLGSGPTKHFLELENWWEQIVFVFDGNKMSRRDIVLAAANKDGGAHVDPQLTPAYRELTAGGLGVLVQIDSTERPITDGHLIALRQMGFEMLNSPELFQLSK